jgi:hypothetical protein
MQPDALERTASDFVRVAVALGRQACAGIVADTVEHLHGYGDPEALRAMAWRVVEPAFVDHLAAQATWPERTDSDRLSDAFRALDASGIVAREEFTCCQSCGTTEIGGEVADIESCRGYVFYHSQDAEHAAAGDDLWLSYGLFDRETTPEIGEEVAAALRAEGLEVDWDGSPDKRLRVPLEWARRRHGRLAAFAGHDPGGPVAGVTVTRGRLDVEPRMPAETLALLELPWLPGNVCLNVELSGRTMEVRRERHRLVTDDGRAAGRFEGLRLLREKTSCVPDEPGLLEVTYESLPTGPAQRAARPMVLPEVLEVLRRLPTRTDSWLSAVSAGGSVVQLRLEGGRLWLETPHPEDATATGKYASHAEAAWVLSVLAEQDRSAVGELPGVTRKPWG